MEAAVHAIEVATAALEPLVFRKRLPHAMHVPARAIRAESDDAVATLADRERDGDVEIPIKAVALVEAADLEQDLAARGGAVALDRLGVAGGDLVEVLQVGRAKAPRPGEADPAVAERLRERSED